MRFETLAEVANANYPARRWCWRGYIVRGAVTGISSAPKVGKTTLVAGLVEAMVTGVLL